MKKFKSLLFVLFAAFMMFVPNVNAAEKVKVYLFEAGGCPWCEKETEYLEGLAGYNETFEIVKKELYVDHVNWEPGVDYELGYKVATLFQSAGFEDASYQGTPFVVISDLYAAAAYSTDLEAIINQAYEEGDKDVVSCVDNGGENCLEGGTLPVDDTEEKKEDDGTVGAVILLVLVAGFVGLMIYARKTNDTEEVKSSNDRNYDDNKEEYTEKEITKKAENKSRETEKTVKQTTKKNNNINKNTKRK
ncbi:MAG: hypothetical protein IJ568_00795 [Bacilli bacterium]|nr:hypothetical protein [Bacilli bacterium]